MKIIQDAAPNMTLALRKRVLRSIAAEQLPYNAGQRIIQLIEEINAIIKDPKKAERKEEETSVA